MERQKNISRQVAGGVAWMLVLRMSLRVLGLISTVVLARLLTPEDFGLVAIAMSFFALLYLIKDFGFDTAIIQMRAPTKAHYDTAWTFNFIFGVALAVLLVASSGWMANFYEAPHLQPLIWAIASLFIIGGLESVGTLDFRKNLTFDREFKLKILPKLIGVPCTLALAWWLRNYWALTLGTIITQLSALCAGYIMHSYRPRFELSAAKELFNFSKWLMANNLIYFINNRSPEMLIGKVLNPQAAGIFSVSNEVAMMTTTEFSAAISQASYPGYAKVAHDLKELRNLYLNVITSTAFLLFPMALGIAAIADLVVIVFLGEQWLEAIPMIRIIAVAGLLMALNSNAAYVFMALGNPRLSTLLGSLRVLIFIPAMILMLQVQGLVGAAWAILVTTGILFVISNFVIVAKLPVTFGDLARAFYRPCFAATSMLVAISLLPGDDQAGLLDASGQLFIALAVGVLSYFAVLFALWWLAGRPRGPEFKALQALTYGFDRARRVGKSSG